MKYLRCTLAFAALVFPASAYSQTFTTLVQFTGTGGTASGWSAYGSLTLVGSSLFGMTCGGGANSDGNVFSVGIDGTSFQNLVSFTGSGGTASGARPYGSLTLVGASVYGMTWAGGASLDGNVFGVGINGTSFQNLISFTGSGGTATGREPAGSLTLVGTSVYGMTFAGGANDDGTVFSVGTNGTNFQNLVSFTGTGGTATGEYPNGSLTLVGAELYGMTERGGAGGYGNVFCVGTNGTGYQNLVSFTGSGATASGKYPLGSLTLVGTRLYGMTSEGGANGYGNVFSVGTDGTGYQSLVPFTGASGTANGWGPEGSLILSGTTLYGMTSSGGDIGGGNIFSVGLDGSGYQDLYEFRGGASGDDPSGDLLLSGGTLFGMTTGGGDIGAKGIVFAYTLPAPTPEPGTLAFAGGGAAVLLGAYRWRRRRPRRGNHAPPAAAARPAAPAATPARR